MESSARDQIEHDVRALCERGESSAAASAALRAYGGEVFGFLMAVHRSEVDANDVFSDFAEALWRNLPAFEWKSTLRTWAYAIARNVSRTHERDAARRGRRSAAASDSAIENVAQAVRTETLTFLRTEKRTRLQALRDSLSEEDRMLLVLRVDRKLEWNDLARVLTEEEGDAPTDDAAAIAREAARLRKRFQIVKDRLRTMAKRQGLIE